MSLDDVRRILGDCEWTIMTSTPDGVGMMRDPDTSANRRFGAADSERRPRPGAQQNQQRDLTPAKLVDALAYALSAERVELLFDYFLLTNICWLWLARIKELGDECNIWQRVLGRWYHSLKSEDQLPDLVGLIFRAAAGQVPGMTRSQRFELLAFAFRLLKNGVCYGGLGNPAVNFLEAVVGIRLTLDE